MASIENYSSNLLLNFPLNSTENFKQSCDYLKNNEELWKSSL